MDWIQGIQRAIDYVEANITDEIDFEETAKKAYSSPFHFQRVFSILCGLPLGDYIRMRRLSLAGEELSKGNAKIIDIAMKYGYDTPESFSRAFTRFHGITPSEAKHCGNVKVFTPLSVKLTLSGGNKMDYRIEKRDAFQVVCKRKRVAKPQAANATQDITAMWQEYGADGTMDKLVACMPENPVMKGLLGICFSSELDAKQFPYGIGVEYDGRKIDSGLEVVTIPASTYAVFTSKGKVPDAFIDTYHRIVTEFFPQNDKHCHRKFGLWNSDTDRRLYAAAQQKYEKRRRDPMNRSESKYFNTAEKMDKTFLRLLEKKDFAYITVKEICETAGVNRSTFYLHYETVADLLSECAQYMTDRFLSYMKHDSSAFISKLQSCPLEELYLITPEYLTPYLNFVKENQRLFRTSLENASALRLDESYAGLLRNVITPILIRYGVPEENRAYLMAFHINGLIAIISEWLKDGCTNSVEHIITVIRTCISQPQAD